MIVLRGVGGVLDESFTVPGLGLNISVRSILQMMCKVGGVDKALCDIIINKPADACVKLVSYGDSWLKSKIAQALDVLVQQVLEGMDCKKQNWKTIVADSLKFSFSDEGISVQVDTNALAQDFVCLLADRAIGASLTPVVNLMVQKLKNACAQLHASKSKPTTTTTTTTKPTTTSTKPTTTTTKPVVTQTPSASSKFIRKQAPAKPTKAHLVVGGGIGLALVGVVVVSLV